MFKLFYDSFSFGLSVKLHSKPNNTTKTDYLSVNRSKIGKYT